MIPKFVDGLLPPGIHRATLGEVRKALVFSAKRQYLIDGLEKGLERLRHAGCQTAFIGGSFVTETLYPNDVDCCYDLDGMDLNKLDEVFFDFSNKRLRQKKRFGCEFFPASHIASVDPVKLYIDFFQSDRDGRQKGIIEIKL